MIVGPVVRYGTRASGTPLLKRRKVGADQIIAISRSKIFESPRPGVACADWGCCFTVCIRSQGRRPKARSAGREERTGRARGGGPSPKTPNMGLRTLVSSKASRSHTLTGASHLRHTSRLLSTTTLSLHEQKLAGPNPQLGTYLLCVGVFKDNQGKSRSDKVCRQQQEEDQICQSMQAKRVPQ